MKHSRHRFDEPADAVAKLRRCGVRLSGKTIWLDHAVGLGAWGAIDYLKAHGYHTAKGNIR